MQNYNDKMDLLEDRLKTLSFQQKRINSELTNIQEEINVLKKKVDPKSLNTVYEKPVLQRSASALPQADFGQQTSSGEKKIPSKQLEDIIGTNIINKIGILITVIGVFIGVKYAIDKDLISPAMRVVLGYTLAVIMIGTAQKLKAKYHDFSSVVMSGGITIIYFITFITYNFYSLFPQTGAFLLMVGTTVLAVRMALLYDRKIIALLGQFGAYAVPFLLSDGNGKALILFSYISIINIGLTVLSVKKDWKIIYKSAFFVSWLIYLLSVTISRTTGEMFVLPFAFLVINFITFYAAFLSYKLVKKELYQFDEIMILLINAFLFFLIGYDFIDRSFNHIYPLTIFTLANACLHIGIGIWIKKRNLKDPTVSMFVLGLGISYITISIPIALAGSWITLLWVIEATILCYIGYRSVRRIYLAASLALLLLTVIGLLIDWNKHYVVSYLNRINITHATAFFNISFANSTVVCFCFGWMSRMVICKKMKTTGWESSWFKTVVPLFFIVLLYLNLLLEMDLWWSIYITNYSTIQAENFRFLTELLYTQLYISTWLMVSQSFIKDKMIGVILISATLVCTLTLLTIGLNAIGNIREFYLHLHDGEASWIIGVRYICFGFLAIQMTLLRKVQMTYFDTFDGNRMYAVFLNAVLLTSLCNEFIHWMDVFGYNNQYKLGLSLICGLYALALVAIGIMKKKKHLRISAIVLFGATLIKLFFYDIVSFSTISKTIVLIILGVILLIASFLYNKFKDTLFDNE